MVDTQRQSFRVEPLIVNDLEKGSTPYCEELKIRSGEEGEEEGSKQERVGVRTLIQRGWRGCLLGGV